MKNPVFSPSVTQFLGQLERLYVDGTLSTDQVRSLACCYLGASPPFPVIAENQIDSHLTTSDLDTCRTGSFAARFRVLAKLTGRGLVPLELLSTLSEGEAADQLTDADYEEDKVARTVAIELWPNAQGQLVAYARLKETSTLSKLDRNRLCRKFGSDSFLTVRFAMVAASLWDKRAWAEAAAGGGRALFDADQCRTINNLRLANLVSSDDTSPHRLLREDVAWTRTSELYRLCKLQSEAFENLSMIKLAGRTFSFLTATTAGVHEQRYIFTSTSTIDVLRWAMSRKSFEDLRKGPLIKLALRVSLLNSRSIATIEIKPKRRCCVADLLADDATTPSRPELIMTDGCGRISFPVAQRAWEEYKEKERLRAPQAKVSRAALYEDEDATGHEVRKAERFSHVNATDNDEDRLPSAFQIRFGGYKGMLVVTREEDMGGYAVIFAKSMYKFATPDDQPEHRVLEIMDFSWPLSNVVFNSEIIDVLSGNSAAPGAGALRQHLDNQLCDFLDTECQDRLLSRDVAFEKALASDDYLSIKLLLAGYPPHIAFLVGFYRKTLLPLHLPIPGAHRLYGVPDRHRSLPGQEQAAGILEFDEVYLRVNGTTVQGEVLVLKEPCFHGSDVRKFRAVGTRPGLEHLENVLVFSTRGPVSPASTIAGSDLDGDKFVVITEKSGLLRLVSPPKWKAEAGGGQESSKAESEAKSESEVEADAEAEAEAEAELEWDEEQVNETMRQVWLRCYTAISGPDACTFSDLLGLRACLVAASGSNWPHTEDSKLLSRLLSQAVDAPKSDEWVQLPDVERLLPTMPEFPHYHPRVLSSQVYPHDSLRAHLYDRIQGWVMYQLEVNEIENPLGQRSVLPTSDGGTPLIPSATGTLFDRILQHKAMLQCNFSRRSSAPDDETRLIELLEPIQRMVDLNYRNIVDLVAFYSQFWKWGFISKHERAHPHDNLPDRRLWRSHPEVLRALLQFPRLRCAGLSALRHKHRLCGERPVLLRRVMIPMDQFREFINRYPYILEKLMGKCRERRLEWFYKQVERGIELLQDQPPPGKWITSDSLTRYALQASAHEKITARFGCVVLDWEINAVLISLILLGYCRHLLWLANPPAMEEEKYSTIDYAGDGAFLLPLAVQLPRPQPTASTLAASTLGATPSTPPPTPRPHTAGVSASSRDYDMGHLQRLELEEYPQHQEAADLEQIRIQQGYEEDLKRQARKRTTYLHQEEEEEEEKEEEEEEEEEEDKGEKLKERKSKRSRYED